MRKFLKNWLRGKPDEAEGPLTRNEPTFQVPKKNVEPEHADEILLEYEDWGNNNLDELNRTDISIEIVKGSEQENEKNPDIFNYLGYTSRKSGNFTEAEEYYLSGLNINPKHNGINEYLGELYVQTNRIQKASERLQVLKGCNCDEYKELELIIKTKGTKIY